ncbi:hypothetical protein BH23GEM5_BH23GEM5_23580 [soil metagenome]|jgi:hypothetical protein
MARRTYILAGLVICFVLVLVYATLSSTTPLGQTRGDHAAATRECQRAIRESAADARFPFAAKVKDLSGDRLQLSGSMDSGSGMEVERRNYECFLSPQSSTGAYIADSVEVWKSH